MAKKIDTISNWVKSLAETPIRLSCLIPEELIPFKSPEISPFYYICPNLEVTWSDIGRPKRALYTLLTFELSKPGSGENDRR
jgi:hypothetical protein